MEWFGLRANFLLVLKKEILVKKFSCWDYLEEIHISLFKLSCHPTLQKWENYQISHLSISLMPTIRTIQKKNADLGCNFWKVFLVLPTLLIVMFMKQLKLQNINALSVSNFSWVDLVKAYQNTECIVGGRAECISVQSEIAIVRWVWLLLKYGSVRFGPWVNFFKCGKIRFKTKPNRNRSKNRKIFKKINIYVLCWILLVFFVYL